jgi:hypothetical protein
MSKARTRRNIVIVTSAAIAIFGSTAGGLAQNIQGQNGEEWQEWHHPHHHPAPAPSIGTGVPTVMLLGGVLLGTALLRRSRQARP